MIQSTELHLLQTPHDAELAEEAGLPALSPEGDECAECSAGVGNQDGVFRPVALVLDMDHHWFLCLPCSSPCTAPKR